MAMLVQPDVDLDTPPDGLEILNEGPAGRIAECFDGGSGCTRGRRIGPVDSAAEHTYALRPEMADGYSLALTLSAVAATI